MWAKTACVVTVLTWGGEKRTWPPQQHGPGQADTLQFFILQAAFRFFPFIEFKIYLGKGSTPLGFVAI